MTLTIIEKADAISFTIKWKVQKLCSRMTVGQFVESPKFTTYYKDSSSIEWCMRLYPKGQREEFKDHLSLFLHANVEIKATADLKIVNNEGKRIKNYTIVEKKFGKMNKTRGTGKFMSHDFMMDPGNGVFNDDKLTILCEITYKNTNWPVEEQENCDNLLELQGEYEAVFTEAKFTDLAIIAEGRALNVHKCILAKRSQVFARMFETEMKEKQENTVKINDINYDVLVEMCRFIYSGKVNNIDTLAGELAVAADKYELEGLKKRCERSMMKNLSLGNVVHCLELAETLSLDKLKSMAIEFMVENASDVCERPEFNSLSREIVREVFRNLPKKNIIPL